MRNSSCRESSVNGDSVSSTAQSDDKETSQLGESDEELSTEQVVVDNPAPARRRWTDISVTSCDAMDLISDHNDPIQEFQLIMLSATTVPSEIWGYLQLEHETRHLIDSNNNPYKVSFVYYASQACFYCSQQLEYSGCENLVCLFYRFSSLSTPWLIYVAEYG